MPHRADKKSVNLKYVTVGRLDDNMIVPPSDGAMFILIIENNSVRQRVADLALGHIKLLLKS